MASKDGWTHDRDHDKVQLGKKQYRNMEEWARPCAVCGEKFSIFVRANSGTNSSFGLRTCKVHRGERPGANGMAAPGEVDALRTANATMREELDGLYVQLKELRDRLAKYELPAVMAVVSSAPQSTSNSDLPKSFPWA
jgi:hypothetical protein